MERESGRRAEALDHYWNAVIAGASPERPAEVDDVAAAIVAHLGKQTTAADSAARERTRQRILADTAALEASMSTPHTLPLAQRPGAHVALPGQKRGHLPWPVALPILLLLAITLVTGLAVAEMWRWGGSRTPSYLAAPTPQPLLAASPAATPQDATVLAEFVAEIPIDAQAMTALRGVAVGDDGTVYVVDAFQDHILRFDRDGKPLGAWGASGTGPGQFRFHDGGAGLGDLALGPDGNLYVTDPFNSRIQVLRADGSFVREWGTGGAAEGQFAEPEGLTVDAAGVVYVADTDNSRVQVFTSDGQFLAAWEPGAGEDGFRPLPGDVAVDAAGNVAVTDARTRQVIRLDADGTVAGTLGGGSTEPGALVLPAGLASDAQGGLFVADEGGSRIQVFAPSGTFLGTIGSAGGEPGQFITPVNLALGPNGLLYVSDGGNRRIQIFRLLP